MNPEYVSAISGLGALVVAVYAALTAMKVRKLEADRDEVRDEERRREMAVQVSAWASVRMINGQPHSGICLENRSQTPIFDVTINSSKPKGVTEPSITLNVVPPGRFFIQRNKDSSYHWEFPMDVSFIHDEIRPIMKNPEWRVEGLTFTDAAGEEWSRTQKGVLQDATTG